MGQGGSGPFTYGRPQPAEKGEQLLCIFRKGAGGGYGGGGGELVAVSCTCC